MHIDTTIKSVDSSPRASAENAYRPLSRPTRDMVDLRLGLRRGLRVPWRCDENPGADLTVAELSEMIRGLGDQAGSLLIGDWQALRRADFWQLLTQLVALRPAGFGLATSGGDLSPEVAQRLRAAGVQRVYLPLHSARQDANDWLMRQPGALKTVLRAIRACNEAGLPVTAEVVLTGPSAPHLPETVGLLTRAGVRSMVLRRLHVADVDPTSFVSLSPRLGLLEAVLERAAAVALDRRVRLSLRDLPVCTAPRLRPLFARTDSERWLNGAAVEAVGAGPAESCSNCPAPPVCGGVPHDYTARFGWEEFVRPEAEAVRVAQDLAGSKLDSITQTLVFDWRTPQRVQCADCADAAPDCGPIEPEATRVVRARLVQAARLRPLAVRLVGADLLSHPQAALLIYDAMRLFPRVEVAGEASGIAAWSDLDLRRIKDLHRIDVALYGPDAEHHDAHCGIPGAFAAMQRAVQRLLSETQVQVGAYAVLHDAALVPSYIAAWERGALPGVPRFRLSQRGASLDALVACARGLPAGIGRDALLAVLPRCQGAETQARPQQSNLQREPQQRVHCGRSMAYHPGGSDPIGAFEKCSQPTAGSCAEAGCVGIAVGWQTARSNNG